MPDTLTIPPRPLTRAEQAENRMQFELFHPRVPAAAERLARYQAARIRIAALPFGSPMRRAAIERVGAICRAAGSTPAQCIDTYHQWPDSPAAVTWINAVIAAAAEI
jgi:hypothetical protein